MKKIILLITLSFISTNSSAQETGTVNISVTDIKDAGKGEVIIMLFNDKNGFPMDPEKASFKTVVSEFGDSLQHEFEGIPFGTYALAIFQDKNENGKVDRRRLVPMPKEPVGVLNITKMSRPKFESSTFELDSSEIILSLTFMNQ